MNHFAVAWLPASRWLFNWDPCWRCGYLLLVPRPGDTGELRFHVQWSDAEVAERVPAEADAGGEGGER